MTDRPAHRNDAAEGRLLVIDDDPLFRTLLRGALGGDHDVETAADGHEGYQLALAETPRLVLLDLMMPTWSGVETLRAFRADAELKAVPVIVLTGLEDAPELDEARSLGADSVIRKTAFSAESLRRDVARTLAAGAAPKPHLFQPAAVPVAAQHFDI